MNSEELIKCSINSPKHVRNQEDEDADVFVDAKEKWEDISLDFSSAHYESETTEDSKHSSGELGGPKSPVYLINQKDSLNRVAKSGTTPLSGKHKYLHATPIKHILPPIKEEDAILGTNGIAEPEVEDQDTIHSKSVLPSAKPIKRNEPLLKVHPEKSTKNFYEFKGITLEQKLKAGCKPIWVVSFDNLA